MGQIEGLGCREYYVFVQCRKEAAIKVEELIAIYVICFADLVHSDRVGYIPVKLNSDNIRIITDLIQSTQFNGMPGDVAVIDFKELLIPI